MNYKLSLICFIPLFLAACTPQQRYMMGANTNMLQCTPQNIQQARYVVVNMARVPLGGHKIQVVGTLGNPSKVESFMLRDGTMLEIMFYRTGEPGCPGMPTQDRFTPFVFQNSVLLGYGNDYYRAFVLPNLQTTANPMMNPPQHQNHMPPQQPLPSAMQDHGSIGLGQPIWQ